MPTFRKSWATLSFFDIFHLMNEHFCASLKIECTSCFSISTALMCACAICINSIRSSISSFFYHCHCYRCCRRHCRCSSVLSIHCHYLTESSINKCVCALSSSSSFCHLQHSFTFLLLSFYFCFLCCVCVPSWIEWRSISIRMGNYLTLIFMRHWIIENWHMYTHTCDSIKSCKRDKKRWNVRVLHVLNYKDAIYISRTIYSSLGWRHTHTHTLAQFTKGYTNRVKCR